MKIILVLITAVFLLSACSPTVGSKKWCNQLKEKTKGEWSANEAVQFTQNCILRADNNEK